jgi:hypothetical protein
MADIKNMTFVAAMLDFFGKNGKTTQDFMEEIKALTSADREYFRKHLPSVGYAITN